MKAEEQNIQTPFESEDMIRVTPEDIRRLVERIVENVHPEKVYLFGSRARGEAHALSDLDLFIVAETDEPRPNRRAARIAAILRGCRLPLDVHVYTPNEFRQVTDSNDYYYDPFAHEVLKDGIELYSQSSS